MQSLRIVGHRVLDSTGPFCTCPGATEWRWRLRQASPWATVWVLLWPVVTVDMQRACAGAQHRAQSFRSVVWAPLAVPGSGPGRCPSVLGAHLKAGLGDLFPC